MGTYELDTRLKRLESKWNRICCYIRSCIGISSTGDPSLVLNQQGDWVSGGGSGSGWGLLGNTGTNDTTNFIGTTDNQGFIVKTNDIQVGSFGIQGNVALGSANTTYGFIEPIASGKNSIAIGTGTASGLLSLITNSILGSEAFGIGSVVINAQNSLASGQNAIIISGESNTASGQQTIIIGNNSVCDAEYSFSAGNGLKNNSKYNTVFGYFNKGGGTPNSIVSNDYLFEIGNGIADFNRNNAVSVYKNGHIALTIPAYLNDANADADADLASGCLYKLTSGRGIYQKP